MKLSQSTQPHLLADIKAFLQDNPNYSFTTAAIADHLDELGWELGDWVITDVACRRLWRAGEIARLRFKNPHSKRSDFRWVYLPPEEPPPEVEEMHTVTGWDS